MEALIAAAKARTIRRRSPWCCRPGRRGRLEVAQAAGVAAFAIDHRPFKPTAKPRPGHDDALREEGRRARGLGRLHAHPQPVVHQAWSGRMLNIHPSLLPTSRASTPTPRPWPPASAVHGCTVHWVTDDLDDGPIVGQAEVPVLARRRRGGPGRRVLVEEHRLYPECLARAARALRP